MQSPRLRLIAVLISLVVIECHIAVGQSRTGPFSAPPRSVRSREVDQRHVRLEFKFDWEKQVATGRAIHSLSPFKPIRELKLDAAEMQIQAVRMVSPNQQSSDAPLLKHRLENQELVIELDREYQTDESLQISVEYSVTKPEHGIHFVTPDSSEPDQPKMVWTQSEPEFARFWFPCIDTPSDRLTSEIIATVPESFFVLSNGVLKASTKNEDGTKTWHWNQSQSHPPYLISVVAGDFEAYEQQWDGIPITSYVPRGRLADAARSFEKTPGMVQFFSSKIGIRYPWPKYAQICVDEYMWGGMEHTSATTLTLRTLHDERAHLDQSSVNLVAHELAHQWWGDLLTCKEWGELWLNESFATYFANLWTEHDLGPDEAIWERLEEANSYLEEDRRYRRPIVSYRYDSPENMFDGHSYPKGARVLHMLRFVLGEEGFWKSMRRYAAVNQHRTVETADLRRAIEDATGQGLNWFFDQWVHHGGHPEFAVEWHWDAATRSAVVKVRQTQTTDQMTPLFRTPAEIELTTESGTELRRIEISKSEESFHFQLASRPRRVTFDPRDWILKTVKFEKSKEELLDQLVHDSNVACRAEAARQLKPFIADTDTIAALASLLKQEAFWGVRWQAAKELGKAQGDTARAALLAAAASDAKSHVRREAIKSLADFKHEETKSTLRRIIQEDPSYYAAAEALRTLTKVDPDNAARDLMAALDRGSHEEVLLQAACEGLSELKHTSAVERLTELLTKTSTPIRGAVLTAAVAKLKPSDSKSFQSLLDQLKNERPSVRRTALDAIVAIGNSGSIEDLRKFREKEEGPRMLRAFDEAIEKLRVKGRNLETLQQELDELRRQNQQLELRLKKLEKS